MKWSLLPAPPNDSTRIAYERPEGLDPLTPREVRERYSAVAEHLELALWERGDLFGFKSGIDERVVRSPRELRWVVRIMRAAGSDDVTLEAWSSEDSVSDMLVSRCYREREVRWFQQVASEMRSTFGLQVEFVDYGDNA